MEWLFLVTGLFSAALLPVLAPTGFEPKALLYYALMVLFAEIVLAYGVLSYAKYRNAKLRYLLSRAIVSWETERPLPKRLFLPYLVSLLFGILLTVLMRINGMDFLTTLLLSLAAAFSLLGWMLMAQKRILRALADAPSFVLAHNGMVNAGKAEVFNGTSRGVIKAGEADGNLCLTVLRGKKTEELLLPIPDDKRQAVTDFLTDMKEYFDGKD
ncbi:MAG: hypothetical protein J6X30_04890 [Clostridia bacterium]|nr:hypothetical protein [Clostridia bacterium]